MNVSLEPGRYVIAVSGGVDSVALLHRLSNEPGIALIVAHYDHGMRPNSHEDRQFAEALAKLYDLPFAYASGALGADAGEARARAARYLFLNSAVEQHQARALITAHHQDDVIETAIINMIRGTGRKGLTALDDRTNIRRPFLDIPKAEILTYAKKHNLEWREDESNQDTKYLRNYIRHRLLPKMTARDRKQLLATISQARNTNVELDEVLGALIQPELSRLHLYQLSYSESKEIMAAWLRHHGVRNFDKKTLERLVVGSKVAPLGAKLDVISGVTMEVGRESLVINKPAAWQKSRTEV